MSKQEVQIKSNVAADAGTNYVGSVKVTYTNKSGKKINIVKHNEGKLGLFTFLSKCLAEDTDAIHYKPERLEGYYPKFKTGIERTVLQKGDIVEGEDSVIESWELAFTQMITRAGKPTLLLDKDEQESKASDKANMSQYTFIIPDNALSQKEIPIYKLRLYGKAADAGSGNKNIVYSKTDYKYFCAEVTFYNVDSTTHEITDENPDKIATNTGGNILVYWKLKILNG